MQGMASNWSRVCLVLGATISKSVSRKADFVLAGSKLDDALKWGICVLHKDDLEGVDRLAQKKAARRRLFLKQGLADGYCLGASAAFLAASAAVPAASAAPLAASAAPTAAEAAPVAAVAAPAAAEAAPTAAVAPASAAGAAAGAGAATGAGAGAGASSFLPQAAKAAAAITAAKTRDLFI